MCRVGNSIAMNGAARVQTHLDANMFQALPTMLSRGCSSAWLLLTRVADFSYLLKGAGDFHTLKASCGGSQGV